MKKETFNLRMGFSSFKAIFQFKAIREKSTGVRRVRRVVSIRTRKTVNSSWVEGKGSMTVWPMVVELTLQTLQTPQRLFFNLRKGFLVYVRTYGVSGTVYATT